MMGGGGGWGGGRFGDRSSRESGSTSTAKRKIEMKPKERVTMDLPATFASGDLDGDGQIGLYEWKSWKRGNLAEFEGYDHNGDGFLTPREISMGPRGSMPSGAAPTMMATTSGTAVGTPDPRSRGDSSRSSSSDSSRSRRPSRDDSTPGDRVLAAVSAEDDGRSTAEKRFSMLDADKDGTLSEDELRSSRLIRAQFENANISTSQPMSKDQFIENFVKTNGYGT